MSYAAEGEPTDRLRVQRIQHYDEGESISALARIYHVALGLIPCQPLVDRLPRRCPGKITDEMIAQIIAARG